MPDMLAALTVMMLGFGPLIIIAALLPVTGWTYDDRPITCAEFWRSGGAFIVIFCGIAMTTLGFAFYRSQRWICYAVPTAFCISGLISPFIFNSTWPLDSLGAFVWVLISWWYFFRKKETVRYFTQNQNAEPEAGENASRPTA